MHETPTHFVDFEASGIHPDSYPISIGVSHLEGSFYSLITPIEGWGHWCFDAQDMHGIARDDLYSEGLAPVPLANMLNELFVGLTLCSDNALDCFWMETLFEAAGIDASFKILPLESWVGATMASEIMCLMTSKRAHNALSDAQALQDAYLAWKAQ